MLCRPKLSEGWSMALLAEALAKGGQLALPAEALSEGRRSPYISIPFLYFCAPD
jgi:hypothetical protein